MDYNAGGRGRGVRRLAMGSIAVVLLTVPVSVAASTAPTGAARATPTAAQAGRGVSDSKVGAVGSPAVHIVRTTDSAATIATTAARDAVLDDVLAAATTVFETTANPKAAGTPIPGAISVGNTAIPATALAAYRKAAAAFAVADPSCHLTWPLLAGIGRVETDHGRSWGAKARITAAGEVVPTIRGPVLDGSAGTATLLDTDGGRYDQDRKYDRAVGPMQFVPSTWRELGRDGNGDGVSDPNNIWDATLAAGGYLCGGGRDLSNPSDRRAAVLAYNPSTDYVRTVLAWATAYARTGSALPALAAVPDPLVLGAGGAAGDGPSNDPSNDFGYGDVGSADAANPTDGPAPALPAALPAAQPTVKPALRPATKPTVRPAAKPKITRTAKPAAKPTAKPAVKPSGTVKPAVKPAPISTPKPTPTATPSPSAPGCIDTGFPALPVAATATTAVDANHDGKNDALRVTALVTAPKAGRYTVGVRLLDSNGWRVTSTARTLALVVGSQRLQADLPGRDIGDTGFSGPATLRITVRAAGAPATCAESLLRAADADVTPLQANSYEGWTTTLARLRDRLAADLASRRVHGTASQVLTDALRAASGSAPDLTAFQAKLTSTTFVSSEEQARLASLAARLIAQAAEPAAAPAPAADPAHPAAPFTDALDPAADGVG